MEFRYEPDTMEELVKVMTEIEESIETIKNVFNNIKDNIQENNDGEAIRKIEELLEGKVSGFEKMGENVEEFKEYIRNYTEELEQFDEQSVCTKPYEIETEEVKKFGKKVIKTIENKN
ncbi:MAG: hypothetical protein ACK5HR_04120 [Mycoplasmatales bacterium]